MFAQLFQLNQMNCIKRLPSSQIYWLIFISINRKFPFLCRQSLWLFKKMVQKRKLIKEEKKFSLETFEKVFNEFSIIWNWNKKIFGINWWFMNSEKLSCLKASRISMVTGRKLLWFIDEIFGSFVWWKICFWSLNDFWNE